MSVPLTDLSLLTWQWHDAELHSIRLEYSADGKISLYLRTELNRYEDLQQLQGLGINSLLVEVQFSGVGWLQITSNSDCSMQELILDWDFVEANPRHHRIKCLCGSSLEIQFEEVGLQEIT
jgi:hypothetical protein